MNRPGNPPKPRRAPLLLVGAMYFGSGFVLNDITAIKGYWFTLARVSPPPLYQWAPWIAAIVGFGVYLSLRRFQEIIAFFAGFGLIFLLAMPYLNFADARLHRINIGPRLPSDSAAFAKAVGMPCGVMADQQGAFVIVANTPATIATANANISAWFSPKPATPPVPTWPTTGP